MLDGNHKFSVEESLSSRYGEKKNRNKNRILVICCAVCVCSILSIIDLRLWIESKHWNVYPAMWSNQDRGHYFTNRKKKCNQECISIKYKESVKEW